MLECQAPLMFSRTKEALLCFYGVLKGTNNQSEFQLFALLSTAFLSTATKVSTAKRAQKANSPPRLTARRGVLPAFKASISEGELVD